MDNEIEHVETAPITANALEQMERASIDVQIATAKEYPRSMKLFYQRAESMVTIDQATAESCVYIRPVGKDEHGKQKFAEGESIRLAEIAAACYGNIRVAGIITEMTARHVKAVGFAHDLETNTAMRSEAVEATVSKKGIPYSERMRLVTAKAAQAKAIRDAIFKVIPKSIVKPLMIKAKEVAKGDAKTLETRRKNVLEWIKKLKVDPQRVWDAIGVKGEEDLGLEHMVLLAGLKTAIEDGDVTTDEAFPKPGGEKADEGKSTVDRIKDHFEDPKTRDKKPKKAKKKKATEPTPPPEKEEPEPPAEEEEPEPEPQKGKPAYKCTKCKRELATVEVNELGNCKFCYGKAEKL